MDNRGNRAARADDGQEASALWEEARAAIRDDDVDKLRAVLLAAPEMKMVRGGDDGGLGWHDGKGPRGLFHFSALGDSKKCVAYLAKEGCDMHEPWRVENFLGDHVTVTPLSLALSCRNDENRLGMFNDLIGAAQSSADDNQQGWLLAMNAAACSGDREIMERIWLRLGAKAASLWTKSSEAKKNLLHSAADGGAVGILDLLWSWEGVAQLASELDNQGRSPKDRAESMRNDEFAAEIERRILSREEERCLSDASGPAAKKASVAKTRL